MAKSTHNPDSTLSIPPSGRLRLRDYLAVASMLFALFFGAGNLIFPLHLGQLSGSNWLQAGLGFLITAVVLPLLSVLAIAITRADGVYGIGLPLGPAFATVFMVLIHATIGPFFGTPRTATVSFTVGLAPLIPAQHQKTGLLIFTTVFFIAAFALAYKENDILSNLGKILNPLFLVLLFIFFLVAFLSPLGSAAAHGPQNAAYLTSSGALARGFLEGYNTMDALAGLAFGVTIVTTIKLMGMEEERKVAGVTAQSGFLAMGAVGVIYILLIIIGAMSLNRFPLSENGGVAFSQIVQAYAGTVGQAFLATLITLTCLTTAVGLVAAFGQDFHKRFPKVSYHVWLALSCLLSFTVANFGLDTIISWSTPVLMLLYPYCIALILLSVFSPLFEKDGTVYFWVVLFITLPALLDMVTTAPAVISQSAFGLFCSGLRSHLPLASLGLTWLIPALAGLFIGLIAHLRERAIRR